MRENWTTFFAFAGVLLCLSVGAKATKNKEQTPILPTVTEAMVVGYGDGLQVTLWLETNEIQVDSLQDTGGESTVQNASISVYEDGWEAQTASGTWYLSRAGKVVFEKE